MTAQDWKSCVRESTDGLRQELIELSLTIHRLPELAFQEHAASSLLSQRLEDGGFRVERGYGGLPTSFRAVIGWGKPVIAILAEYDALPKVGHACGHNIIAAAAYGAGMACRPVVEALGGAVAILGAPAEEAGGGKVILVEKGAFGEVDVAMMVHPGVRDTVLSRALACVGLEVEYLGKAAHAAARPEEGINALEALLLAYNAVNALRQHIKDRARIHGIITDGGEAPNIVPAHAAASFLVRAEDDRYLEELKEKVLHCFQGAALATGAQLQYHWAERPYQALRTNKTLAEAFGKNLEALGRKVHPPNYQRGTGSTDMGNVSAVVPSIHPSIAIAPSQVVGHSPEFAAAAASEGGHQGLIDGAKALAMTVVDLLSDPGLLSRIQEEFQRGE